MKLEYNWGPSLPYYLAAEYNIHPTYIQKMLLNFPIQTVLKAILYLKNKHHRNKRFKKLITIRNKQILT